MLSLPSDVIITVLEYAKPCDVVAAAQTCRALAALAQSSSLWTQQLGRAVQYAVDGLATPYMHPSQRLELQASLQGNLRRCVPAGASARVAFFVALRWLATAVVEAAARHEPRQCFLSLDRRAYDVSSFVEHHPGSRAQHLLVPQFASFRLVVPRRADWPTDVVRPSISQAATRTCATSTGATRAGFLTSSRIRPRRTQ